MRAEILSFHGGISPPVFDTRVRCKLRLATVQLHATDARQNERKARSLSILFLRFELSKEVQPQHARIPWPRSDDVSRTDWHDARASIANSQTSQWFSDRFSSGLRKRPRTHEARRLMLSCAVPFHAPPSCSAAENCWLQTCQAGQSLWQVSVLYN